MDILVEICKIARLIAGNLLYRRFISNMAAVVLFAMITGMLVATLFLSGCYATYITLLRHGFETDTAALIVGGIITLATVLSAIFTLHFIHRVRNALLPLPANRHVGRIASAFMDGFTESDHK